VKPRELQGEVGHEVAVEVGRDRGHPRGEVPLVAELPRLGEGALADEGQRVVRLRAQHRVDPRQIDDVASPEFEHEVRTEPRVAAPDLLRAREQKAVPAAAAGELVPAEPADQAVVAVSPLEHVVAAASFQTVCAAVAGERVGMVAAGEVLDAGVAVAEGVARVERGVRQACDDAALRVPVARRVGARPADQQVRAGMADEDVVPAPAVEAIVAAVAIQAIGPMVAAQVVVEGGAAHPLDAGEGVVGDAANA
jgi:hypothetical protein